MTSKQLSSTDNIKQPKTSSSRLQATYPESQMDSHFLYNTLTIISILAEEHGDIEVSEMCIKLTRMLRYIKQDAFLPATLSKELEYTHNYSDLMSVRFGSKINFCYDTASELGQISVPRLIIQPLVENCVKYCRDIETQLQIQIHTYKETNYWIVSVRDNGIGFSKEALNNIEKNIDAINSNAANPSLLSNFGMGITNIYLRLKLFYGHDFIFNINSNDYGSTIKIGGKIHEFR